MTRRKAAVSDVADNDPNLAEGPIDGQLLIRGLVINPHLVKKFWSNVKKREGNDCWQWMGSLHQRGFGWFRACGRFMLAHQFAWELERGPVLPHMLLMQTCNNRGCVRPTHLEHTTRKEMMRRRAGLAALRAANEADSMFVVKQKRKRIRGPRKATNFDGDGTVLVMPLLQTTATGVRAALLSLADLRKNLDHQLAELRAELRASAHPVAAIAPPAVMQEKTGETRQEEQPATDRDDGELPPEPTIAELLTLAYQEATGSAPDDEALLSHAFDLAIAEAGGSGSGATLAFRGWLMAYTTLARAHGLEPTVGEFLAYVSSQSVPQRHIA